MFAANATGTKVDAPVMPLMAMLSPVEKGRHGELFDKLNVELEGRINLSNATANPMEAPSEREWKAAKKGFVRGFEAGLNAVDTLLGGLSVFRRKFVGNQIWEDLKTDYKDIGYSGVDPNLSRFNLVVRREIYCNLRKGKTMDKALAAGLKLAAEKQGKMLKSVGTANPRVG